MSKTYKISVMVPCPVCNKEFTRRDSMKRHMRCLHNTCNICLRKIGDGSQHICHLKPEKAYNEENEVPEHLEFSDDEENSNESTEKNEEFDYDSNASDASDSDDKEDIYSRSDEDLESDASISDSETEEESQDRERPELKHLPWLKDEDSDSNENADTMEKSDVICLEWPCRTYFLTSLWQRFGDEEFKIIEHYPWLEEFHGLSDPQTLSKVKRATDNQFEVFCEIAKNILAGNVYTRKVNRTFLLKNKNLIRALSKSTISLERKRRLVLERGPYFISTFVQLVEPLFETIRTM